MRRRVGQGESSCKTSDNELLTVEHATCIGLGFQLWPDPPMQNDGHLSSAFIDNNLALRFCSCQASLIAKDVRPGRDNIASRAVFPFVLTL